MRFTNTVPSTWNDLQNKVAKYLIQSGYTAQTPCEIRTARGKIEVDIFVEAPDDFIKKIVIECKFWNKRVPKEKIHAFRTVVQDAGANLGVIISKNGFQSGAKEAALFTNVILLTWDEFLLRIMDKWIITQLVKLKSAAHKILMYTDPNDFPYELLSASDNTRWNVACKNVVGLHSTCWTLTKSALLSDTFKKDKVEMLGVDNFQTIDYYIEYLLELALSNLKIFEEVCINSNIEIKSRKLNGPEGLIYMYLN